MYGCDFYVKSTTCKQDNWCIVYILSDVSSFFECHAPCRLVQAVQCYLVQPGCRYWDFHLRLSI